MHHKRAGHQQMQKEWLPLKELYYIRGIARKRLGYFNDRIAIQLLQQVHDAGYTFDSLKKFAIDCRNCTEFRSGLEKALEQKKEIVEEEEHENDVESLCYRNVKPTFYGVHLRVFESTKA